MTLNKMIKKIIRSIEIYAGFIMRHFKEEIPIGTCIFIVIAESTVLNFVPSEQYFPVGYKI